MKYRRLGRTGLAVSPIALGTMGFGPPTAEKKAEELLRAALDLGVNLIDTANCYDGPQRGEIVAGHAESMLGRILQPSLRDEVVLISKVGVPMRPGPQHRGLSSTHILRELDHSLRRLQTDFLDVYMIHWPDVFSHIEEVLRAIDRAVSSGKVRYFGISNHQAWQVCEYLWTADRRNLPAACVSEIPISLLDRRYENDLPFYERHEVAVLAYQPLAGGLLTDRYACGEHTSTSAAGAIAGWSRPDSDAQRAKVIELKQLADGANISLADLAIAWTASRTAVAAVVLGCRSTEQIENGLRAVEAKLPAELESRLNAVAPPPAPPQPRFER